MPDESLKNDDLESLTEIFRKAGARNPEMWAGSQIEEGINQLARFSFLKTITSEWLKEDENFADILVQTSPALNGHAFPKLKLRDKPSFVQVSKMFMCLCLLHICINSFLICCIPFP